MRRLAGLFEVTAEDPAWEVRSALAGALAHLLHPAFDPLLARLQRDPSGYVRRTAEETQRRRRRATRAERPQEEEEIRSELLRLSNRHSPQLIQEVFALARRHFARVASSVAHDVLATLTPLEHSVAVLERELSERRVPRSVWKERLGDAARYYELIAATLRDMKELASPAPAELAPLKLREVVQEAVHLVQQRLPDSQAEVRLEVDPELTLDGHRVGLVRLFKNVVRNAFEALEGEGRVRIGAVVSEREVVLEVQDDGCGVFPEDLASVWNPGFSTKKTKKNASDNTGWGLAIARRIVDDHRGRISLDSEAGRGTTVTIALPLDQDLPEAEA